MRSSDPARGQHILETAARLFAQRHYHEVRMEDIAQQAGVAKGTLYRYFADKEALYLALILSGLKRLFEELQTASAAVAAPEEQVLLYVRRSIAFFEQYPYFLDLVQRVEVASSDEKLVPLLEARQRFWRFVSAVIERLHASGRFHAPHPDLAALALNGMTRHILRFYPQPWPADLAEIITEQFLHGLHAPTAHPGVQTVRT